MLKVLGVVAAVLLPTVSAFAETAAVTAGGGYGPLAGALGLAIAVVGGAMAQGKICAAAMEGIARNPSAQEKMFVSMIIGLVLIESLVIYMLVIAFSVVG
jgi:F-type H+-transporting ATPase subunit c